MTLLEDCDTLELFTEMPKEEFCLNYGDTSVFRDWISTANIMVCCPEKLVPIVQWEDEVSEVEEDPGQEETTYVSFADLEYRVQQDFFYNYSCPPGCRPIEDCGGQGTCSPTT